MQNPSVDPPSRYRSPWPRRLAWMTGLVLLAAVGLIIWDARRDFADKQSVESLVEAEELILLLTPELKSLQKGAMNLKLPDFHSRELWSDSIQLVDLAAPEPQLDGELANLAIQHFLWPVAGEGQRQAAADLQLWRPFLETLSYFEHAKFYFIDGHFLDKQRTRFRSHIGFSALARTSSGRWRSIHAQQQVDWEKSGPVKVGAEAWKITDWQLQDFHFNDSRELLFQEILDSAIPDPAQRELARRSLHEEIIVEYFRSGTLKLSDRDDRQLFRPDAMGKHPGLAVVDLDQNGWDDLYVMERWGKNQLWMNQGDGTFVEQAAGYGLDLDGHCNCALFADFDNDGDADVFVGRGRLRGLFLVNEQGTFVDRSQQNIDQPLPALVTSIAAADYDGDGLLDVYLSTYGLPERDLVSPEFARRFLTEEQVTTIFERYQAADPSELYLNAVGPPNLLLRNLGDGRFGVPAENKQLEVWHNTFQSTWADFDADGDVDLYVSNDFAPDRLFQNQGASGFADVTEQYGGQAMMGFGMGASWGDYDNDGRQDLYVSNMFSKAGTRITASIRGLDARYARSAEGNRLLHNRGNQLQQVSGTKPPALLVAQADWSWGGQFADFDNNGLLDIYVTSGYYTAPREIAQDVDL